MIKNWLIEALGGRTEEDHRIILNSYLCEIRKLELKIEELRLLSDGTPEHCKRGEWCKQCVFVKTVHVSPNRYTPIPRELYFCGKGDICPSMIARDEG